MKKEKMYCQLKENGKWELLKILSTTYEVRDIKRAVKKDGDYYLLPKDRVLNKWDYFKRFPEECIKYESAKKRFHTRLFYFVPYTSTAIIWSLYLFNNNFGSVVDFLVYASFWGIFITIIRLMRVNNKVQILEDNLKRIANQVDVKLDWPDENNL